MDGRPHGDGLASGPHNYRPHGADLVRYTMAAAAAVLVACAGCATMRVHGPTLEVYAPATVLLHDAPADNPDGRVLLSLTGRGFGARDSASGVRLRDGDGRVVLDVGSDDEV